MTLTDQTAVARIASASQPTDGNTGGERGAAVRLHRMAVQDAQLTAAIVKLSRTLAMYSAFHFVLALLQALWGK